MTSRTRDVNQPGGDKGYLAQPASIKVFSSSSLNLTAAAWTFSPPLSRYQSVEQRCTGEVPNDHIVKGISHAQSTNLSSKKGCVQGNHSFREVAHHAIQQ
ncbi:hypothetical protein HPB51_025897 [Rhipicephalus microplus]|uniref:Uncharacterized protein n=1 Tax=Rhipicephalus microplus TaxID=6941 RepID=A0A9J6EJV3_RHIMP|nr:hypothetical protein HPB51_025897 [Rhipicephalus microplus]